MPSEIQKLAERLHAIADDIKALAGFGGAGAIARQTTVNSNFRELSNIANGIGLKADAAITMINELIKGTNTGYTSKAIPQLSQAKTIVVKVRAALNNANNEARINPRTPQVEYRLKSAVNQARAEAEKLAALLPAAAKESHTDGTKLVPSSAGTDQPTQK